MIGGAGHSAACRHREGRVPDQCPRPPRPPTPLSSTSRRTRRAAQPQAGARGRERRGAAATAYGRRCTSQRCGRPLASPPLAATTHHRARCASQATLCRADGRAAARRARPLRLGASAHLFGGRFAFWVRAPQSNFSPSAPPQRAAACKAGARETYYAAPAVTARGGDTHGGRMGQKSRKKRRARNVCRYKPK